MHGGIRSFVAIIRFVVIYALFGRLLAKKVLFCVKSSVSWTRSVFPNARNENLTTIFTKRYIFKVK